MRWGWLLGVVTVLWCVSPAVAVTYEIDAGQTAPVSGILLDQSAVVKAVESVRDAESFRERVNILTQEVLSKDREIANLEAQVGQLKQEAADRATANAINEDRFQRQQEIEARYRGLLDEGGKLLAQSNLALKRADERIESLEKRAFWTTILMPITLFLGLLAGGL
jgi:hypothetical protein